MDCQVEVELERRKVFEPTCTICGLESGYQGPWNQDDNTGPGERKSGF